MDKLIGRKKEREELEQYASSDKAEFIVVYGRRRIGKTFLVRETFAGDFYFCFTGIAHATLSEQLSEFTKTLARQGHICDHKPKSWFDAFGALQDYIESSKSEGKKIIFLDEMPWMDTHKSKFVSAFEHFWNGWASGRKDLLLIACGSATSWITNNVFRNRGGLYNRITGKIKLSPFTLAECAEYYSEAGILMNMRDMLESYMVFGGVPYYLSFFDKRVSFTQNVDRLCFGESAKLSDEFYSLYRSIFKDPARYLDVIQALASKKKGLSRDEVVKLVKIPDGGNLTRILLELEECGFIRKYRSFSNKTKGALYQLIDFFTLFYLTFMKDGSADDGEYWSHMLDSAEHRAWCGYSFEQLCLCHAEQIKKSLGISGIRTSLSSWKSHENSPGAQIDLLIDRGDSVINVCEMKYWADEYTITKKDEETLRRKLSVFRAETKTRKALHLTLVTTYGIKRNQWSAIVQSEVTAEDLLR
jgi:AAA+ ATPase superfamily predicted ATPase